MSFNKMSNTIEENDTILLYINYSKVIAVQVKAHIKNKNGRFIDNVIQTQFGALKPMQLVGKEYGTSIRLKNGFIYALKPSSVLWTEALPHRTQIIYPPDISMILYQLEISRGKVIIESGTGSAALSHSFIRMCKPAGHLHTFEVNEKRYQEAEDEFKVHGLSEFVTVYNRNVCENGFGDELRGQADAIFLDLPSPHLVISYTIPCFKTDEATRFCSFSPCIEQVQRTCQALEEHGFTEIQTMELIPLDYTAITRSFPNFSLDNVENENENGNDETNTKKRKLDPGDDNNDGSKMNGKKPSSSSKWRQVTCGGKRSQTEYVTSNLPQEINSHTGYITVATMLPIWARDISLDNGNNIDPEI